MAAWDIARCSTRFCKAEGDTKKTTVDVGVGKVKYVHHQVRRRLLAALPVFVFVLHGGASMTECSWTVGGSTRGDAGRRRSHFKSATPHMQAMWRRLSVQCGPVECSQTSSVIIEKRGERLKLTERP